MTKLYPARIAGVVGADPGPASGIEYTVDVFFDVSTQRVYGVTPHNKRWPDTVNTAAATVGDACICFETDGHLQFFIWELPDTTECSQ